MTTTNELSKDLNISSIDIEAISQGMVASMIKDNCVEAFVECYKSGDKEMVRNFIEAYVNDEIEKSIKFTNKYITNENFSKAYQLYVLEAITNTI